MSLVSGPGRPDASALPEELQLAIEPHVKYIQSLDSRKDELEYWLTEHLRLNGLYWGLNSLHLLGRPNALPRDETIKFVLSCQDENGGFGAAPGHDAHLLYTCSAVQILAMVDALDDLEKLGKGEGGGKLAVGKYIASLQNRETGTFAGDEWGEKDTRFLYTAFNSLSLLHLMELVDMQKAVDYIVSCANFDGGYGVSPDAESHSGQIFACVGALSIAGRIDLVNCDKLGRWLSERQVEAGGLNGRPEKVEDVCYSWWVATSLKMIGRLHWIDGAKLTEFILKCQDPKEGGFADRPGDMVDVFHTNFGLAGLSLLEHPELEEVDPIYVPCYFDSLCPKNPQFSDISHLLTHISSKSHLANRFKLQIRAQAEEEARDKLENFDFWYRTHNLDGLLSERLAMKEQKKAAKDKKNRVSNGAVRSPVKKEEPGKEVALATTPVYRAPVPRMHLWPTTGVSRATPVADEWANSQVYETPTATRRVPNFEQSDTPAAANMLDPKLTTPFKPEDDVVTQKLTDSAKLKGIIWPGMDLFDSATPEMKRMRNQRKDGNVLEQMMALSAGIESSEISYFPNGEFRGSRDIFGPLSGENSPIMEKQPSPKKRRVRKPTFSDVNGNAPRLRAPRSRKPTATKSPEKRPSSSSMQELSTPGDLFLKPAPALNPLAAATFGQQFAPVTEEEDEFRMTMGGDMKQKRSFGIFQDAPEISPDRTESSLEDHRFDFANHGLPQYPNNSTFSSLISPTPAPKTSSMRTYGKENHRPDLLDYHQARRPAPVATHIYPPQYFNDSTFNPLYHGGYTRAFSYGDYQHGFNEDMKPLGYGSTFQGDFRQVAPMTRASQSQGQPSNSNNEAGPSNGMHYGIIMANAEISDPPG
ncbi:hypothetical protein G7Y89_g5476 [Cudoniella acicularis]|uniref:protein geranylgeranyltransferase type II n=1 Tax=Cudoniella acicularis TaxID=354080 RepID=A0A8H4W3C8_9HELO|nr:hypothetical protein G7Y89_g5476 [Cudoniella acicularis]